MINNIYIITIKLYVIIFVWIVSVRIKPNLHVHRMGKEMHFPDIWVLKPSALSSLYCSSSTSSTARTIDPRHITHL